MYFVIELFINIFWGELLIYNSKLEPKALGSGKKIFLIDLHVFLIKSNIQ